MRSGLDGFLVIYFNNPGLSRGVSEGKEIGARGKMGSQTQLVLFKDALS